MTNFKPHLLSYLSPIIGASNLTLGLGTLTIPSPKSWAGLGFLRVVYGLIPVAPANN